MRMYVDQAGEDGHGAQVDFPVAGLCGSGRGGGNRGDSVSRHDDGPIGRLLAGANVDDVAGANQDSLRGQSGCQGHYQNKRTPK